jgi:hypothetical protein
MLALAAMALVVPGCGASRDAARESASGGTDSRPAAVSSQPGPRKVVYTADLTVRVGDVARAITDAIRVTTAADGFVFAQSSDLQGRQVGRLTLKVPSEHFDPVLSDLAGLGRALARDVKAADVTEEVVDVEGRLRTAQARADRLRALLGGAPSTSDIVAVEAELAKREADIESLAGRSRVLTDQVDLATINLRLTETADLEVNREVPGFLQALRTGGVALLSLVLVGVAAGGFLLPFTPVAVAGWWILRRHRRSQP